LLEGCEVGGLDKERTCAAKFARQDLLYKKIFSFVLGFFLCCLVFLF
jgi:hypothetical protein